MEKEIILNVSENETRIAILEDKKLFELAVERPDKERMLGDIYKAKVKTILPGMQAAFVDIGWERNAFLHVSDIVTLSKEATRLYDTEFEEEESEIVHKTQAQNIQDILKPEQDILVQVVREPIDTKGPRVTTQISLAGRYLVLIPGQKNVGVSRKISDWQEKKRLKKEVRDVKLEEDFGIIVRTMGIGRHRKDFLKDIKNLTRLWQRIKKLSEKKPAPFLLYKDISMTYSLVRDLFTPDVDRVVVDNKLEYKKIMDYLKEVAPNLRTRVEFYSGRIPIFDFFNIESEIEKMLERKIWIKKGAYIVIDQTEALVAIDVNTGRFVGKTDQEDTILRTNLEAAKEIARQIRLRDIGGLIVVDFIDMVSRENRRKVYEEFKKSLRSDRSKFSLGPLSEFGLIEMTREKTKPSLIYTFSEPCPTCNGFGRVLSKETMATKIERWFRRAIVGSENRRYELIVNPVLAGLLTNTDENRIRRLGKQLKLDITVVSEDQMPQDEFKVISVDENLDVTEIFKA